MIGEQERRRAARELSERFGDVVDTQLSIDDRLAKKSFLLGRERVVGASNSFYEQGLRYHEPTEVLNQVLRAHQRGEDYFRDFVTTVNIITRDPEQAARTAARNRVGFETPGYVQRKFFILPGGMVKEVISSSDNRLGVVDRGIRGIDGREVGELRRLAEGLATGDLWRQRGIEVFGMVRVRIRADNITWLGGKGKD